VLLLFAESSELVQIVTVVVTFLGTCFTAVMAFLVVRLNKLTEQAAVASKAAAGKVEEVGRKAEVAAGKVEEVKKTLVAETARQSEKLDGIAEVGRAVHTLVNSSMSNQLKVSMIALRRVAHMTRDPEDMAAAELAEQAYHDQEEKQRIVDLGGKITSSVAEHVEHATASVGDPTAVRVVSIAPAAVDKIAAGVAQRLEES